MAASGMCKKQPFRQHHDSSSTCFHCLLFPVICLQKRGVCKSRDCASRRPGNRFYQIQRSVPQLGPMAIYRDTLMPDAWTPARTIHKGSAAGGHLSFWMVVVGVHSSSINHRAASMKQQASSIEHQAAGSKQQAPSTKHQAILHQASGFLLRGACCAQLIS